jgi:hypothetical protein
MPVDLSGLIAAVNEATTVDESAVAFIAGFSDRISAAVTAALEADASADQTSIDAANAAIKAETDRLLASKGKLSDAILNNTPNQPEPEPEPEPEEPVA